MSRVKAALRSRLAETVANAAIVLIVFHAASGLAGVAAVTEGADPLTLWNVAVRAVMVAALIWSARAGGSRIAGDWRPTE